MAKYFNSNFDVFFQLKYEYDNSPWYKKWLYPTAMSRVLARYSLEKISLDVAFEVCDTIFNKKMRFFQRWFFVKFSKFSQLNVTESLSMLSKEGLLTRPHFVAVVDSRMPLLFTKILCLLKKSGLLSGEQGKANVDALAKIKDLDGLYGKLSAMRLLSGIEGQSNFNVIVKHPKPIEMTCALQELKSHQLLTGPEGEKNRAALLAFESPLALAEALVILNNRQLLSGPDGAANRDMMLATEVDKLRPLLNAILVLGRKNLLSGDEGRLNRIAVWVAQYPQELANAFVILNHKSLLSGDEGKANRHVLSLVDDPCPLARVIVMLSKNNLLSGVSGVQNRFTVATCKCLFDLTPLLEKLDEVGLLTQVNFDNVFLNQTILCYFGVWFESKKNRSIDFKQDLVDKMISVCEENKDNLAQAQNFLIALMNQAERSRDSHALGQLGLFADEVNQPLPHARSHLSLTGPLGR